MPFVALATCLVLAAAPAKIAPPAPAPVIDGLEADVFSIKGFKWGEQAKHLTLTAHWFLPKAVRVNARWLDSLPEDLRAPLAALGLPCALPAY